MSPGTHSEESDLDQAGRGRNPQADQVGSQEMARLVRALEGLLPMLRVAGEPASTASRRRLTLSRHDARP